MFITDVKSAVAYYSVDETETETEMKALVVITKQRGKRFSVGQIGPSFYFCEKRCCRKGCQVATTTDMEIIKSFFIFMCKNGSLLVE